MELHSFPLLRLRFLRGFYFIPTRWHDGQMKGFLLSPILLILSFGTPASTDDANDFEAGLSGDDAVTLKEWKPLAEKGNAEAQNSLGYMYSIGQGVTQDYKTAYKWYKLSAEQGNAEAQYNMGLMYDEGYGVIQNDKAAFTWYTTAAKKGYANAQYNLALMYGTGRGVNKNYTRAHMWWGISASQGIKDAAWNRDMVGTVMTPSQVEKAQELARQCVGVITVQNSVSTKNT